MPEFDYAKGLAACMSQLPEGALQNSVLKKKQKICKYIVI